MCVCVCVCVSCGVACVVVVRVMLCLVCICVRPGGLTFADWQGDVTGKFPTCSAPDLQTYSALYTK